jgi:hypothetical protein
MIPFQLTMTINPPGSPAGPIRRAILAYYFQRCDSAQAGETLGF